MRRSKTECRIHKKLRKATNLRHKLLDEKHSKRNNKWRHLHRQHLIDYLPSELYILTTHTVGNYTATIWTRPASNLHTTDTGYTNVR